MKKFAITTLLISAALGSATARGIDYPGFGEISGDAVLFAGRVNKGIQHWGDRAERSKVGGSWSAELGSLPAGPSYVVQTPAGHPDAGFTLDSVLTYIPATTDAPSARLFVRFQPDQRIAPRDNRLGVDDFIPLADASGKIPQLTGQPLTGHSLDPTSADFGAVFSLDGFTYSSVATTLAGETYVFQPGSTLTIAVPEPTSGLAAVPVVCVALRRKR